MQLDLVGGELKQAESMWGRTRYGAKPAAPVGNIYRG